MKVDDETALIDRCKKGDKNAWHLLVYLRGPSVEKWIDVADLPTSLQEEVFGRVWETVAAEIGNFNDEKFCAWLLEITNRRIADCIHVNEEKQRLEVEESLTEAIAVNDEPFLIDVGPSRRGFKFNIDHGYKTLRAAMHMVSQSVEKNAWKAFWQMAIFRRSAFDLGKKLNMSSIEIRAIRSEILARFHTVMNP